MRTMSSKSAPNIAEFTMLKNVNANKSNSPKSSLNIDYDRVDSINNNNNTTTNNNNEHPTTRLVVSPEATNNQQLLNYLQYGDVFIRCTHQQNTID